MEMTAIETLAAMLAYCRPHQSKAERRFIRRFIEPLGVQTDAMGNLFKRIGDAPVLWSSHTDSVHRHQGNQRIVVAKDKIRLPADSKSSCLGADCATGVWLMREMILANRPGLYVFHRAEEVGGKGSSYIAQHRPQFLEGIRHAIAFDRRGTKSIITHQGWGRCCSDTFALALGAELGLGHAPDDSGTFTDTANYTDLVSECTNVSVGYDNEHRSTETQDTAYAMALREALLSLDVSRLPIERRPGDDDWRYDAASYAPVGTSTRAVGVSYGGTNGASLMQKLVSMNPAEVAELLDEYGFTVEDVAQYVFEKGGAVPTELYQ